MGDARRCQTQRWWGESPPCREQPQRENLGSDAPEQGFEFAAQTVQNLGVMTAIQEATRSGLISPASAIWAGSEIDARILKRLLSFPKLEDARSAWRPKISTEFHMMRHKKVFRSEEDLAGSGWVREEYGWRKGGERCLPLFEGSLPGQRHLAFQRDGSSHRYWISEREGREILLGGHADDGKRLPYQSPRLACLRGAAPTDTDSVAMCLLPGDVFCGGTVSYLSVGNSKRSSKSFARMLWLLGFADSLVMRYLLRHRFPPDFSRYLVREAPCPLPGSSREDDRQMFAVAASVAEMACNSPPLQEIARAVGVAPQFGYENSRYEVSKLRAKVDALIAFRFGLSGKEFMHIIESFSSMDFGIKINTYGAYQAAAGAMA